MKICIQLQQTLKMLRMAKIGKKRTGLSCETNKNTIRHPRQSKPTKNLLITIEELRKSSTVPPSGAAVPKGAFVTNKTYIHAMPQQ